MAITGYINKAYEYRNMDAVIAFMEKAGCSVIYNDTDDDNRAMWRYVISKLDSDDTIIIGKASNAMLSISELVMLMQLCYNKNIRFISVLDGIVTAKEYYDYTADDLLKMCFSLGTDNAIKRQLRHQKQGTLPLSNDLTIIISRRKKMKQVINMYHADISIDTIMDMTGIKSKATVFRILKKFGVQYDRTTRRKEKHEKNYKKDQNKHS